MNCRQRDFQWISASPKNRADMVKSCQSLVHSLTLYTSTSLKDAMNTPVSDIEELFAGDAFKGHLKERETAINLQVAMIGRIDMLASVLAKRR